MKLRVVFGVFAAARNRDRLTPAGRWRPRAAVAEALRSSGEEEEAAAVMLEARTILRDFAATLAPGRARTLLAAPAVREVLDTQS